EGLALTGGTIADADQLELLLVALADAFDHVPDQGSGQPVQGAVQFRLTRPLHQHVALLDRNLHLRIEPAREFRAAALDRYGVIADGDRHTVRDLDRKLANPTHGSPNVAHDLAAEAGPGCLLSRHDAVRGRQDHDP